MPDYEKTTVADLRQELKERHIPSTGLKRKQQIIEKLEENDAEREGNSAGGDQSQEEGTKQDQTTGADQSEENDQSIPSKRSAEGSSSEDNKRTRTERSEEETKSGKPRLTTPDISYDYDRSQLRDPRPTPGRVKRPYYEDLDCPDDLKKKFETEFEIPKPERPKGRLNAFQKNELFCQESLLNPLGFSHVEQVMKKKGPNGSPTYDRAGFELDYHKVVEGTRPRAYNKKAMIRNMDKAVEKGQSEKEQIFNIFFLPGEQPDGEAMMVEDYVKDQVSKDLGVPWHQIGPKHLKEWEEKGFKRVAFKDWWTPPNEEEDKRMMNMTRGCVFRKDL